MTLKVITTSGRRYLILNNFKYRETTSLVSGNISWRCCVKECKSWVKTDGMKSKIVEYSKQDHNHAARVNSTLAGSPKNNMSGTPGSHTTSSPKEKQGTSSMLSSSCSSGSNLVDLEPVTNLCPSSSDTQSPPGGSEDRLRELEAENSRLREEVDQLQVRLRDVVDHSIQSDARLLEFTSDIFTPHNSFSSTRTDLGTSTVTETPAPDLSDHFTQTSTETREQGTQAALEVCSQDVRSLEALISTLQEQLEQRDLQVVAMTADNTSLKDRLGILNKTLEDLHLKKNNNDTLLHSLKLELKLAHERNAQLNSGDKWVDEHIIADYFRTFSSSVDPNLQCIFFSPATTQLIKSGPEESVLDIVFNSSYAECQFAFLCVNNGVNVDRADDGTHWSLLFIHKSNRTDTVKAYHFDSLSGMNHNSALQVISNLNIPKTCFVEVSCYQQKNGYECGINVLINSRFILNFYCVPGIEKDFSEWYNNGFLGDASVVVKGSRTSDTSAISARPVVSYPHLPPPTPDVDIESPEINSEFHRPTTDKPTYTLDKYSRKLPVNSLPKLGYRNFVHTNRFDVLSDVPVEEECVSNVYGTTDKQGAPSQGRPCVRDNNIKCRDKSRRNKGSHSGAVNSKHTGITTRYCNYRVDKLHDNVNTGLKDSVNITNVLSGSLRPPAGQRQNSSLVKNVTSVNSNSKIVIIGDSHARHMSNLLQPLMPTYKVMCLCYPGAPMLYVVQKLNEELKKLSNNDTVVLVGGTNNTSYNHYTIVLSELSKILYDVKCNFIVTEVPYLYCQSKRKYDEIVECNRRLVSLATNTGVPLLIFSHCLTLKDYLPSGGHFNIKGKIKICRKLSLWLSGMYCDRFGSHMQENHYDDVFQGQSSVVLN